MVPLMWAVLIAALGMAGYAGYLLWQAEAGYQQSDDSYAALNAQVRSMDIDIEASGAAQPGADTWRQGATGEKDGIYIPKLRIDFGALKEVSQDAIAWLYCPDTAIDYPVMRASDYSYYLNHLPDGTVNAGGSLFLDYNCAPDFSGVLSIVYGHHMKSGSMFGSLEEYKKQGYYEQHPCMYLYTPQGDYRISLLYGCVIAAGEWRDRAFMFEENLPALLNYAAYNTTFSANATLYTPQEMVALDAAGARVDKEGVSLDNALGGEVAQDRFIVLSTCSYEFDEARYIVIGVVE